jgi:hypothetical protein
VRKAGVLVLVLVALYALAQAIALLETPVFLIMNQGDTASPGVLALVLTTLPPIALVVFAAYLIVSRDSLASRWFADEPIGLAVDALSLLRVSFVFAGVLIVALAIPSVLRVLASPVVDAAQMSFIAGGEPVDYGQAYLRSLPYLLPPVVQLVLGFVLVAQSGRLATRLWSGPTAGVSPSEPPATCPSCGEPFDPADYREDVADPRCTSCGGSLGFRRAQPGDQADSENLSSGAQ